LVSVLQGARQGHTPAIDLHCTTTSWIRSRLMVEMFPTEFYALAPQKRVISRDTSRPS
jgi:hypothetical protein